MSSTSCPRNRWFPTYVNYLVNNKKEPLPIHFMRSMCVCVNVCVSIFSSKNVKVICFISKSLLYLKLMVSYVYIYTYYMCMYEYTLSQHHLSNMYVCLYAHLHVHAWPMRGAVNPKVKSNKSFHYRAPRPAGIQT